jgi:hypothetical protein
MLAPVFAHLAAHPLASFAVFVGSLRSLIAADLHFRLRPRRRAIAIRGGGGDHDQQGGEEQGKLHGAVGKREQPSLSAAATGMPEKKCKDMFPLFFRIF